MPPTPLRAAVRAAVSLAVAITVAGSVTGCAHAHRSATGDARTRTQFTPAEMTAAIRAARNATTAADRLGWATQETQTGTLNQRMRVVDSVTEGRQSSIVGDNPLNTTITVRHRGTYTPLFSPQMSVAPGYGGTANLRRILESLGRPHATWLLQHHMFATSGSPDVALSQFLDPAHVTITGMPSKTISPDGTTTYSFTATVIFKAITTKTHMRTGLDGSPAVTMTVGPDDVVTSLSATLPHETDAVAYTYGAQYIALPPARQVVTYAQLDNAQTN